MYQSNTHEKPWCMCKWNIPNGKMYTMNQMWILKAKKDILHSRYHMRYIATAAAAAAATTDDVDTVFISDILWLYMMCIEKRESTTASTWNKRNLLYVLIAPLTYIWIHGGNRYLCIVTYHISYSPFTQIPGYYLYCAAANPPWHRCNYDVRYCNIISQSVIRPKAYRNIEWLRAKSLSQQIANLKVSTSNYYWPKSQSE